LIKTIILDGIEYDLVPKKDDGYDHDLVIPKAAPGLPEPIDDDLFVRVYILGSLVKNQNQIIKYLKVFEK
jgi:hypothetical protein